MTQPRPAKATVKFVDDYCQWYQSLFPEVRSFEAFKHLHIGMISDIKRKSLPAIAKVAGLEQEQSLHHFLSGSPWKAEQLRQQRLKLILQVLEGREIILIIDETGDRKKGDETDYVKRQYIGNLGKIENGIVAVTAYGVIEGITFPLTFEVYKPKERLQQGDTYLSKPEIAAGMIRQLQAWGFRFKLVLADSLYGESGSNFIDVLYELKLPFHLHPNEQSETSSSSVVDKFSTHPWWNQGTGWKNLLNNLRLILQPFVLFNLISPWLKVFPIPALSLGFSRLIALMNHFQAAIPISLQIEDFLFSAA
jgi:SRSO17 transposase